MNIGWGASSSFVFEDRNLIAVLGYYSGSTRTIDSGKMCIRASQNVPAGGYPSGVRGAPMACIPNPAGGGVWIRRVGRRVPLYPAGIPLASSCGLSMALS